MKQVAIFLMFLLCKSAPNPHNGSVYHYLDISNIFPLHGQGLKAADLEDFHGSVGVSFFTKAFGIFHLKYRDADPYYPPDRGGFFSGQVIKDPGVIRLLKPRVKSTVNVFLTT